MLVAKCGNGKCEDGAHTCGGGDNAEVQGCCVVEVRLKRSEDACTRELKQPVLSHRYTAVHHAAWLYRATCYRLSVPRWAMIVWP